MKECIIIRRVLCDRKHSKRGGRVQRRPSVPSSETHRSAREDTRTRARVRRGRESRVVMKGGKKLINPIRQREGGRRRLLVADPLRLARALD